MTFVVVVAYVVAYAFVTGLTLRIALPRFADRDLAVVASAFWPVYLPAVVAQHVGDALSPTLRDQRRRERELTEAEHRKRVAWEVEQEALSAERAYRAAKGELPEPEPRSKPRRPLIMRKDDR